MLVVPGGADPDRPAPGRIRAARANDVSVLIAAKEVFAEQGWSAPMSAVAERARVGVGSLYRRYPSKESLAQALRIAAMDQISEIATDCAERLPARDVLATFLDRYLVEAFGPLVSTLGGGRLGNTPEVLASADRMRDALGRVADVARGSGHVPADYGPTDILLILIHLRPAIPGDPAVVLRYDRRILEPLLAGLRVMASSGGRSKGDKTSAPRWDEWVALWSGA